MPFLAGIVGFLIAGIGGFYLVVLGFDWFNTIPRDEMSQGIMGSLFAMFIALPLGVFAGAIGAMLAARWTRRIMDSRAEHMTRPPSLDYAAVRPSRHSAARRRLIVLVCCLGASWLVWLCIFLVNLEAYDSIDDGPLVAWLMMTMVGMGTLCGLIVYVVALFGLWLWSAVRRRRASAS